MKKIWTLAVCALMATSLTFAQEDDSDGFIEQANESAEEQEESTAQAEEATEPEEAPAKVQAEKQADQANAQSDAQENAQENAQNNDYAQEAPRHHENRFGIGIRTAFDYGIMYGFSDEDDNAEYNPKGIGFEGGLMLRILMIPHLYFTPEFNVAYITTNHKIYSEYDRTYKSLDLEIPLLIRGVVADKFYVAAGPQLVLGLSSDADIDVVENKVGGLDLKAETHETIKQTNFTFGLAAGAGFSFIEGLFIDVRIYMGLMDLYPDVKTVEDFEDGKYIDPETGKLREFSVISMKGAKMMKLKVGLSYWFI
jgi:opacity protein-like surface antigen